MIKAMSNVDNINKIIRTCIIQNSNVSAEFVRNALSGSGPRLDKHKSGDIFETIEHDDILIIFELQARNNNNDMSETDENDIIRHYQSFTINIIIYGDSSHSSATILVSRMRTEFVRNTLYEQGVHIENVSNTTSVNEFKNDTMWMRTDFSIDITCRFEIEQATVYEDFDSAKIITIPNKHRRIQPHVKH